MRVWKIGGLCAAIVLAASVSLCAVAQAPGGGQGRGQGRGGFGQRFGAQGPLTLASIPDPILASELKLTDEQKTKIADVRKKMQADMAALRPADGTQGDPQAMRQKFQEINTQTNKDIEAVLTDDQKKQSKDLIKDLSSLRSVGIPMQTYSDLKLTDDEKKKIGELAATIDKERAQRQQDIQAARQAGDQAKVQELLQASPRPGAGPNEKALALLTDTQKETVTKYIKDHPQQGGGRRPGGNNAPPPPANR